MDPAEQSDVASAAVEEIENEYSNEDSVKYPIQEMEEEPFVKVEIRVGLEQLKVAMKTNEVKDIRASFNNLTKSYPTANLIWYSWAQYEYVNGNFEELEKLFTKCLKNNLSVPLWRLYLSYVRNNQLPKIADESEARQTMLKAYDFAVSHIGLDVASGPIWAEYLEFTQSNYHKLANEKISTWEQQQLMDLTRKVYHRALLNPMDGLENLWHSYDAYENNLNKLTAKKLVAEKSSGYMAARSALKELHDLINGLSLDEYPVAEEYYEICETEEYEERFESWMKWIDWERKNPLTTANKPLLHSRIVYAFRRALMSLRGDEEMWLNYSNYFRFEAGRAEDAELVLRQARRFCPMSVLIVLAAVDLKEARGSDLEAIRPILDEFISGTENKLNQLKSEIVELARRPSGSDDDDDEIVFEGALVERQFPQVSEYLRIRKAFNGAQVRLLELARRLGGLSAGRNVFASARKSAHASAEIFSAAANLEFRIRKDAQIAAKIYELGFNRFPTDRSFAREYLNFLLAQNDDGNIRALFERIVASIEGFRSTHSLELIRLNEDVEVIKGIWSDFYGFEKEIGDYQSVAKLEDRIRAAFPDEIDFKSEHLFMARIKATGRKDLLANSNYSEFILPKVKSETEALKPFNLPEPLFNLLLKINERIKVYEGPSLDIDRFVSFIERAALPSSDKIIEKEAALRPTRSISSNAPVRRRRRDNDEDDRDFGEDRRTSKRVNSSIFEERRRY